MIRDLSLNGDDGRQRTNSYLPSTQNNSRLLLRDEIEELVDEEAPKPIERNQLKLQTKTESKYEKKTKEILRKKLRKAIKRTGVLHAIRKKTLVINDITPGLKALEEAKQETFLVSHTVG